METAIFVGGPLHGEIRNVREGQWTIAAAEYKPVASSYGSPEFGVDMSTVRYSRTRFVFLGHEMLTYVVLGRRYSRETYADLLDLILTPEAKAALQ